MPRFAMELFSERLLSSTAAAGISYAESTGGIGQHGPPQFKEGNYTILNDTCIVDGRTYTPANLTTVPRKPGREFVEWTRNGKNETIPMDCLYLMSKDHGGELGAGLAKYMEGLCVASSDENEPITAVNCYRDTTPANASYTTGEGTWWLLPLFQNGTATFQSLASAFDDLTNVVTHIIRSSGSSVRDLDEHQFTYGTVQRSTICTKFEWRWLLFPVILTITAVALLVWGIVASQWDRWRPVWKNPLLPLLFYGFEGQPRQRLPAANIADLDTRAKETTVTLKYGDDTGFVEQPGSESIAQHRPYNSE